MPDTPANQAEYPQSFSQQVGIGFPIARACAIVSLATACVLSAQIGPYSGKQTGESVPRVRVNRCITRLPQSVEEVEHLAGEDMPLAKPAEHDRQIIQLGHHDADSGRRLLREQLCKLSQTNQGEVGVLEDKPLGLRGIPHQQRMVLRQETEIG